MKSFFQPSIGAVTACCRQVDFSNIDQVRRALLHAEEKQVATELDDGMHFRVLTQDGFFGGEAHRWVENLHHLRAHSDDT